MTPPRTIMAALLLAYATALSAEPTFVGSRACAACHPGKVATQAQSGHAHALSRPSDHTLAKQFPSAETTLRDGDFLYRFETAGEDLVSVISDGRQQRSQVIEWAFGAGEQAVTFVSRLDEAWYLEHHLSYYTKMGRPSLTPGHQASQPQDLGQALGVRYKTFSAGSEIMRCFRCHSTGPLSLGQEFAIEPSELGIRCESCHGPGSQHVEATSAGRSQEAAATIDNPGRLSPSNLLVLCGACHRPPGSDPAEIDYQDPWNVRHQPVYLSRSACFINSQSLTCMTCHDPHQEVRVNDASYYNARCTTCHEPSSACPPASKAACTSCHMPKVWPQPNLAFTNHWIAVYDSEAPLRPRPPKGTGDRKSDPPR